MTDNFLFDDLMMMDPMESMDLTSFLAANVTNSTIKPKKLNISKVQAGGAAGWVVRLALAWTVFKITTFVILICQGIYMFWTKHKTGDVKVAHAVMFSALMMLVFGISFSKVFSDNLWVIFLMQYFGSALVNFVLSLGFLPLYWQTKIKDSASIKGIIGAQCVYFTLLAMFAFIPALPKLYGNGPVFSC